MRGGMRALAATLLCCQGEKYLCSPLFLPWVRSPTQMLACKRCELTSKKKPLQSILTACSKPGRWCHPAMPACSCPTRLQERPEQEKEGKDTRVRVQGGASGTQVCLPP